MNRQFKREGGVVSLFRGKGGKLEGRIWLNIIMFVLFLLSILSAYVDKDFHKWVSMATTVFVWFHLAQHSAWIRSSFRLFGKNAKWVVRSKVMVALLLFFIFFLLSTSGMIAAVIYSPKLNRYHEWYFVIFLCLVFGHLYLNLQWILGVIRQKRKRQRTQINGGEISQ